MNIQTSLCLIVLLTIFPFQSTANPSLSRIVGGENVLPGEFPYHVSLRNSFFGHFCGGALISPNLVVTAAVCVDPWTPTIHEVVVGSLKRTENVAWQQVRNISHFVMHPEFNLTAMDNDLALVFLEKPFIMNANVSTVHLPPAYIETFPKPVVLSGWGNVQPGEPMLEDLQKVTLDTYSDRVCEDSVGQCVRPEKLCTGVDEGGKGGCQGDAGSPVVMDVGNMTVIAAVLSHFPCPVSNCCGIRGPNDQSTELSFYVEWILDQSKLHGGGL